MDLNLKFCDKKKLVLGQYPSHFLPVRAKKIRIKHVPYHYLLPLHSTGQKCIHKKCPFKMVQTNTGIAWLDE